MKMYGISSMHFGVVMGLNLAIGLVTPPVGACLLLGNEIAGAKLATTMKCVLPMIILSLIVLMITTYMPATTQWLPSLMK
jgi:C4-dicarboxylate transporter DctM subunit